ncbi:hypothetical protein [Nocardiopsis coralliicola]
MATSRRRQASRLTDAKSAERRRTRGLPESYPTGRDGDRGGGGGDSAIAEALMHSALRAGIRKGGLQNSGLLAAASLRMALYRRRWTPPSEDRPALSPKVVQAAVPLVQQGDAGEVARQLDVGREQVGRVKQTAGFTDASELLHDHWAAWRLEQQAHRTLKDSDPAPGTPLSGLWRTAADDASVLSRAAPRDTALLWFSAANSQDPASSAVESTAIDQLAERNPALWYSIERGIVQDPEFNGDLLSGRTDKATALAGAVWQADGRPMETMEEYFAKALPWFRDKRSDLNLLRDTAEAAMTAEADGRLPAGTSRALVDDARRSIPGFADAFDRARDRAEDHAAEPGARETAALSAFDELRGMPERERAAAAPRTGFVSAADAPALAESRTVLNDFGSAQTAVGAAHQQAEEAKKHRVAKGMSGHQTSATPLPEGHSSERRTSGHAVQPGQRKQNGSRSRQWEAHRSRVESPRRFSAVVRTRATRRAAAARLTRQTRTRNQRAAQIHRREKTAATA